MTSPSKKFHTINTLWQAIGGAVLAPILIVLLAIDYFEYAYLSGYELFMWLNVAFLFFHEFEDYIMNPGEYRHVVNYRTWLGRRSHGKTHHKTSHYEESVFTINLFAWACAIWADTLPWIGMSFIITNAIVNCFSHAVLFHFPNKAYNPGLISVVFLFIPLYTITLWYVIADGLMSPAQWAIAIAIGIATTLLTTAYIRYRTLSK